MKIKNGWINIYKLCTGRLKPGTAIYDSKEVAQDTARHKRNLMATVFVSFAYVDREWIAQVKYPKGE
jgi:hypothetical protein